MKYFKSLFIIALAAVTFVACGNKTENETELNSDQQTEAYESAENDNMAQGNTIVKVASETPSLSTLVQAIKTADRENMLSQKGPYTVFAPTNTAFDALPAGTVDNLMMSENEDKLRDILAYHVVEGEVMAADLSDGQMVTTVQGEQLEVSISNGNVMINGATVSKADVQASNGVVHVINKVLMPSGN